MTYPDCIDGDGTHRCPQCGSLEIEGGTVEIVGHEARQEVGCNGCDTSWIDIYRINTIIYIKVGGEGEE